MEAPNNTDHVIEDEIHFYSSVFMDSQGLKKEKKSVKSPISDITYNISKYSINSNQATAPSIMIKVFYTPKNGDGEKEYFIRLDKAAQFIAARAAKKDIYVPFPNPEDNLGVLDPFQAESFYTLLPSSCYEMIAAAEKNANVGVTVSTLITSFYGPQEGEAYISRPSSEMKGGILDVSNPDAFNDDVKKALSFYYHKDYKDPGTIYSFDQPEARSFIMKEMMSIQDFQARGVAVRIITSNNCPSLTKDLILLPPVPPPQSETQNQMVIPTIVDSSSMDFPPPPSGNFQDQPQYLPVDRTYNLLQIPSIIELPVNVKSAIDQFLNNPAHTLSEISKKLNQKRQSLAVDSDKYFNLSTKRPHDNTSKIISQEIGIMPQTNFNMKLAMTPDDMTRILEGLPKDDPEYKDYVKAVFQEIAKRVAYDMSKTGLKPELPLMDIPFEVLTSIPSSINYKRPEIKEDSEAVLFGLSNYSRFPVDPSLETKSFKGKKNELVGLSPLEAQIQNQNYQDLLERNKQPYPLPRPYVPNSPLIKEISNFESSENLPDNWKPLEEMQLSKSTLLPARPPRRDVALLSRRAFVDSKSIVLVQRGEELQIDNEEDDFSGSGGEEDY